MSSRLKGVSPGREASAAAGIAQAWVDLALARGISRSVLLESARFDPDLLVDQDERIPVSSLVRVIRAAKDLSGEPALGLHFGETLECAQYSVASMLSLACATIRDALVQKNRYGRLLIEVEYDGADRFVLEPAGDCVWVIDTRRNPNEIPELTESLFARMASASHQQRERPFLREVRFTHPEPGYRHEYDRIFRVPLVFGSDRNALLMEAAWLEQPIALAPRYVFGILSAHADALLERLEGTKTARGTVEGLLLPTLHTGETGIETIARKMGLSRQTLSRRLRAEGVTFEQTLDELRHRMALGYLQGKKVSVNETAYLVGFSDPSSFSRAFKRWTGSRPHLARL